MKVLTYNLHGAQLCNLCMAFPDFEFFDMRGEWFTQRPQPSNWHPVAGPPPTVDMVYSMNPWKNMNLFAGVSARRVVKVSTANGHECEPHPDKHPRLVELESLGWSVVFGSKAQALSWGYADGIVIRPGLAIEEWPQANYAEAAAVASVNNYHKRPNAYVQYELFDNLARRLPVRVLGFGNEAIPGAMDCVTLQDYQKEMSAFRAFLNTPRMLPNTLAEAMAMGLAPVSIASGSDGPDLIVSGTNGFVSDDPGTLYDALKQLINDAQFAARLGIAARETARGVFERKKFRASWERVIAQTPIS